MITFFKLFRLNFTTFPRFLIMLIMLFPQQCQLFSDDHVYLSHLVSSSSWHLVACQYSKRKSALTFAK